MMGAEKVGPGVHCLTPDPRYIDVVRHKVAQGTRGGIVRYQSPTVFDLGSIVGHTYDNPGAGDKMDVPIEPFHLDKFCEFSGGTDPDNPICLD